jgi:hypothetical protein
VPPENITSEDDYDLMTIDSLGNLDVTYFVCTATDFTGCIDSVGYDRETVMNDGIEYEWIVVNTLDTIGFYDEVCGLAGQLLVSPAVYNNEMDTIWLDTIDYDYCTYKWFASPVNITDEDRVDTLRYEGGNPITRIVPPFKDFVHSVRLTTSTAVRYIDRFLNGFDPELTPDLTGSGWHYRGWILSPQIDKADYGALTRPAWSSASFQSYLNPVDAGVVSTGVFYTFDGPDMDNSGLSANPYISASHSRIPPFPGEDFLNTDSLPGGQQLTFVNNNNPEGFIFITIEPDNYWDPHTNFPIILFSAPLPGLTSISNPIPSADDGNFYFINLFYNVSGTNHGFPSIDIDIAVK